MRFNSILGYWQWSHFHRNHITCCNLQSLIKSSSEVFYLNSTFQTLSRASTLRDKKQTLWADFETEPRSGEGQTPRILSRVTTNTRVLVSVIWHQILQGYVSVSIINCMLKRDVSSNGAYFHLDSLLCSIKDYFKQNGKTYLYTILIGNTICV